jgi:tryptophan synthase beta subunit
VEVFDGDLVEDNWNSFGKFCGPYVPQSLISTFNNMTVKFTSDKSINYKGFVAEYEIEDQSEFNIFFK